ncbi:MAG: hypothetical protein ABMB14_36925, partial [Myxococcota bacterium]
MVRTFVEGWSDIAAVTVHAPRDGRYRVRRSAWGAPGVDEDRAFADHRAAIDAYLAEIDGWLARGFVERAPTLAFVRGDERFEVRPPVVPELWWAEPGTGRSETARFDTLVDAVHAYNTELARRSADGFRFALPAWHTPFEAPTEAFEPVTRVATDDPQRVEKRWYRRVAAPHDEFGPEWWYGPDYTVFNYQIDAQRTGPSVYARPGELVVIMTYHRNLERGPTLRFDDAGRILRLVLHETELHKTRVLAMNADGPVLLTDGTDAAGRDRGVWIAWGETGRTDVGHAADGSVAWREERGPDGTLVKRTRYAGDEPVRRETWDAEHHAHLRYAPPGVLRRADWYRFDGTRAVEKGLDDQNALCRYAAYDAAGVRTHQRERRPDGTWWQERCDGDGRITSERPLDAAGTAAAGDWVDRPVGAPTMDEVLAGLFDVLEREAYLPGPRQIDRHATTAAAASLPDSLEDHVARLFCLPDGAFGDGGGTYPSPAGSVLALRFDDGWSGELRAADGFVAATFAVRSGDNVTLELSLAVRGQAEPGRRGAYELRRFGQPDAIAYRRGWWIDVDAEGRVRRAQCFDPARHDHAYDDAFHDLRPVGSVRASGAPVGEGARALALAETPSRAAFLEICRVVEREAARDPDRRARGLIAALAEPLGAWPEAIREAPLLWIDRLILGWLPI